MNQVKEERNPNIFSQLLKAICSFPQETEKSLLDSSLIEALVPSHHPIGTLTKKILFFFSSFYPLQFLLNPIVVNSSPTTYFLWNEIVNKSGYSAQEIVENNTNEIIKTLIEDRPLDQVEEKTKAAILVAIQNLSKISPTVFVPTLFGTLVRGFDVESLKGLTQFELAVYATPDGQLYENGYFFQSLLLSPGVCPIW